MPTVTEIQKTAQEQILSGVKQSQALALSGLDLWVKSVTAFTANAQVAAVAVDTPTPQAFVEGSFAFAEQLLAAQKEFATKVAETTAPLFSK